MIRVDPAHLATDPAPAGAGAAAAAPETGPGPRPLIEQQLAMLTRLAEMGMAIAEAATAAATAAPSDAEASQAPFRGDAALAYTRVARAVRLTLALQTQLLKDLAALEAGETAAKAKGRERVAEVVRRGVFDTHAEAGWRRQADLADYARESLKEAEDDADLLGLPFTEAVARICQDLDLPADWTARAVAAAGGGPLSLPSVDSSPASQGSTAIGSSSPVAETTGVGGIEPTPMCRRQTDGDRRSRDGGGAPPEDDGDAEDTFLEWPPPPPT